MAENIERELGWDDEIENDSREFVTWPNGIYDFEVVGFERLRHDGSDKLPPCNKPRITLQLTNDEGETINITDDFIMLKSYEWRIASFFLATGKKKRGETFKPNWSAAGFVGLKGRVEIKIHTWKGKDGDEMTKNQVKKYIEPEETPAAKFTPGAF